MVPNEGDRVLIVAGRRCGKYGTYALEYALLMCSVILDGDKYPSNFWRSSVMVVPVVPVAVACAIQAQAVKKERPVSNKKAKHLHSLLHKIDDFAHDISEIREAVTNLILDEDAKLIKN